MKSLTCLVLVFLVLPVFAQIAGSAKQNEDPAAAVARMARIGSTNSPSFSPDGKWISAISNMSGTPQLYVIPAAGGWPRMVTNGDDPVVGAEWSPASDWMALTIAPGGGLNTQVYVVHPDGTALRRLTDGGKDNNSFDAWSEDGKTIVIDSNRRDPAARDTYAIELASGELRLVAQNPGIGAVTSLTRDAQRGLLFRLRSRSDNNLYLLDLKSGKDTLLTPHDPPGNFNGDITLAGDTVYLSTNKDRDLQAFGRIKLNSNGSPGPIEVLAERKDAELDGFALNKQATMAALFWNVAGRTELALFDLAAAKTVATPKLPGELAGGTFSRDGSQLALTISGSAQPSDVWIMDIRTKQFRQISFSPHAGDDLSTLVRPELVTFPAHDGLQLSGWLYRPKDYPSPGGYVIRSGAYVISFHGGPEGQERPAFRSDYQALLARGIGVFAPNVRGSSGFGKKFVNLDNGELRFNGVKDIKSCVDYLVNNQIANPKRIGITGGSYGGYMTMAGLTEYPDLFAAGVDLFGIVNFATFFEHTQPWMAAISTIEYGDPVTQKDLLAKLSPIYKLDRIKAATMVQHGANDTNVPVIEAEQIVKNLKERGVPVDYILFPDEGHGFRKIPNRIKSTVEMVRFFSEHLVPEAQARAEQ